MNVTIDACEFNNIEEFHELIKEKMNFADDYNDTLESLWDNLVHKCKSKVELFWLDYETSKTILGDDAKALLDLFQEADEELNYFHFEIQV